MMNDNGIINVTNTQKGNIVEIKFEIKKLTSTPVRGINKETEKRLSTKMKSGLERQSPLHITLLALKSCCFTL